MAKKNSKGRVRVFFAEFEGEDETIQEGMKALAVAVNKTFQPKVIVQQAPPASIEQKSAQLELFDSDEEAEDYLEESEQILEAEAKPAKPPRKRKLPTLSIVKDLDLVPGGKESLEDFFKSKGPKQQNEKITVCLYWMQKVLEIEGITPNHVYTCFKRVGAKVPANLPQEIRNIAKRKGWIDASDSNLLTVTVGGENLVEHDLVNNED